MLRIHLILRRFWYFIIFFTTFYIYFLKERQQITFKIMKRILLLS